MNDSKYERRRRVWVTQKDEVTLNVTVREQSQRKIVYIGDIPCGFLGAEHPTPPTSVRATVVRLSDLTIHGIFENEIQCQTFSLYASLNCRGWLVKKTGECTPCPRQQVPCFQWHDLDYEFGYQKTVYLNSEWVQKAEVDDVVQYAYPFREMTVAISVLEQVRRGQLFIVREEDQLDSDTETSLEVSRSRGVESSFSGLAATGVAVSGDQMRIMTNGVQYFPVDWPKNSTEWDNWSSIRWAMPYNTKKRNKLIEELDGFYTEGMIGKKTADELLKK